MKANHFDPFWENKWLAQASRQQATLIIECSDVSRYVAIWFKAMFLVRVSRLQNSFVRV